MADEEFENWLSAIVREAGVERDSYISSTYRWGADHKICKSFRVTTAISKEMKINIIIYLIAAAVIGWLATYFFINDRSNLLINIIVAVVGAFLSGYFLSPFLKFGTINDAITIPTMLVTLLGSVMFLVIVHAIRRRR